MLLCNKARKAILLGAVMPLSCVWILMSAAAVPVQAAKVEQRTERTFLAPELPDRYEELWQQEKQKMLEALDEIRELGFSTTGILETTRAAYETYGQEKVEEAASEIEERAKEQAEEIGQQVAEKAAEKVEETADNLIDAFFERLRKTVNDFLSREEK